MSNFFSKFTDSAKNVVKNPLNPRNYLDLGLATVTGGQVDTHGVNGIGSFEDVMYGKKTKVNPDQVADMVKAGQIKGVGELNHALDTPSENIVRQQADQAKTGIIASAQDARRNVQRMMAAHGLANSSLGLAQNRSIDMDAGKQIAGVDAALPGQIRDQQIQDANTRISQGGLGPSNPIQWNTVTNRGGGMLDLAGKIAPLVGSYYGMQNLGAQTNYLNSMAGRT
jgi:hypothetical protein